MVDTKIVQNKKCTGILTMFQYSVRHSYTSEINKLRDSVNLYKQRDALRSTYI